VIETVLEGELADLDEEVFTQGTADTAVRHLDHLLLGVGECGVSITDEISVDIDLGHVIDDDGDTLALTVVEDMVEEGGFARSEES